MAAAARLIKPDVQLYHAAFHFSSLECAQSTAEGEKKREWSDRVSPNSVSRALRVRTGAAECRLSPDCVGKHQGPKRKRLSGAPGAHKSAAGYTALAGPGAKGQSAAVNPAASHPHSGCAAHININTHIASRSSSPLRRFSNRCRLLFPFRAARD